MIQPNAARTAVVLVAILVSGCREKQRDWAPDEPPPPLTVSATVVTESLTTVRATLVLAPDVSFEASLQRDPDRRLVIVAPAAGTLSNVVTGHHTRIGNPLATMTMVRGAVQRDSVLAATIDGQWVPIEHQGQRLQSGDTIGVIRQHGFWLAVGQVGDPLYRAIHRDERATIRFANRSRRQRDFTGIVQWVTPPGTTYRFYAEVGVSFEAPEESMSETESNALSVIIRPGGARDSLPAIPKEAIVVLPPFGPAVFEPLSDGDYRIHWIWPGPVAGTLTTVREGLRGGTMVLTRGLQELREVARDSLNIMQRRRR